MTCGSIRRHPQGPAPSSALLPIGPFYEFATDRAVLTEAIVHTLQSSDVNADPDAGDIIRQLSQSEYNPITPA